MPQASGRAFSLVGGKFGYSHGGEASPCRLDIVPLPEPDLAASDPFFVSMARRPLLGEKVYRAPLAKTKHRQLNVTRVRCRASARARAGPLAPLPY